jgi:flavin reductase (DIM6/NTAB) family NADH-FMN oxidoreductase RutF
MRFDLEEGRGPERLQAPGGNRHPPADRLGGDAGCRGRLNAAPYSFFNVMGSAPPTVAIGIMADPERGFKDTSRNILDTGEFVVNLVPERLVPAMNVTAVDAPRGVDELVLAGLATEPSAHVRPPRIAESPVAFECVSLSSVVTGPGQVVVIGRVLTVHIADDYVLSADRAHVDTPRLDLVAPFIGQRLRPQPRHLQPCATFVARLAGQR